MSSTAVRILSVVVSAKAGTRCLSCSDVALTRKQNRWIPAFAGMTSKSESEA